MTVRADCAVSAGNFLLLYIKALAPLVAWGGGGDGQLLASEIKLIFLSTPGLFIGGKQPDSPTPHPFGNGLTFPSPEDRPDLGIKPESPAWQAESLLSKPHVCVYMCIFTCVCMYVYTHIYVYVYIYVCMCFIYIYVCFNQNYRELIPFLPLFLPPFLPFLLPSFPILVARLINPLIYFYLSPDTGAPNLPVMTSKKFPMLVSTLLKIIPLF